MRRYLFTEYTAIRAIQIRNHTDSAISCDCGVDQHRSEMNPPAEELTLENATLAMHHLARLAGRLTGSRCDDTLSMVLRALLGAMLDQTEDRTWLAAA